MVKENEEMCSFWQANDDTESETINNDFIQGIVDIYYSIASFQ